jgi:TrwC relaxase
VTAEAGELPFRGVTMSLHKLTAGSGYDYLTRQVAALDATDKGHIGLASYYTERGESPGVWVGSGMEGRRSGRRRSGDSGADARLVRVRVASVGRAAAPAAGRPRPHWTGLPGRHAVGGTAQDQ